MQLALKPYKLKLKHRFGISRESYDVQDTLIVSLSQDGITGYGEATANQYYNAGIPELIAEIEGLRNQITAYTLEDPLEFEKLLLSSDIGNFARCALDLAAHDLYGKLLGKPLYELWGTSLQNYPVTNYTIGLASIDRMIDKLQETPWPIYKIKLGTEDDIEIVKRLRDHTDAVFRIDANCAWDVDTTLKNAAILKDLGVEFLEQPLPAEDWMGMAAVKRHCVLPVIADESCIREKDVGRCAEFFDGINIKLTKCGGLSPALRMIQKGREFNLKIMVGCMTESTVGISAIAQLLPQLDYVDMDGAMLLDQDIASGVAITPDARVIFPTTPGSGIKLIL